mmetsp:Transcript_124807/g.398988  ORF Transcript_124807/g.398988 Transcript_124807/m.398988 type:complete len:217 (+) Transcript_124807:529-1179(+)
MLLPLLGVRARILVSLGAYQHLHLVGPLVVMIIEKTSSSKEAFEEVPQVVVIRSCLERKAANVPHVGCELLGETFAKVLDGNAQLLVHHHMVLSAFGDILLAIILPWQAAAQEVEQDVPQRLQIVPSALVNSGVSVDAHEAQRPDRPPALLAVHMLPRARIQPCPDQAKVGEVNGVCTVAKADQEVGRLQVSVEKAHSMHMLQALQHLVGQAKHRL